MIGKSDEEFCKLKLNEWFETPAGFPAGIKQGLFDAGARGRVSGGMISR